MDCLELFWMKLLHAFTRDQSRRALHGQTNVIGQLLFVRPVKLHNKDPLGCRFGVAPLQFR
jgi:hypothetical protein